MQDNTYQSRRIHISLWLDLAHNQDVMTSNLLGKLDMVQLDHNMEEGLKPPVVVGLQNLHV